jgi:glycosyltransferase involved in cell wall biosynthesis
MIRVAFFIQSNSIAWLGGRSYLRNLIAAIYSNADRCIEPVLFVDPSFDSKKFSEFPAVQIIPTTYLRRNCFTRLAGKFSRLVLGCDLALETLLLKHRVDVLSHSGVTGARSNIPAIAWIPDFQHIRAPWYFSKHEVNSRNIQFKRIIGGCDRLILSSHDALSDFRAFAPGFMAKSRVLQFVSSPPATTNILSLEQIHIRFQIDSPYFHLPNQFWAHKNHAVVVEALSILKSRDINVLVLATGMTNDYRNPSHFQRLMGRIKFLGIEENFRVLGVVTYEELYSLMINATALINPSYFEGWSTTVEESKSLGLPMVLSDIPVHREQAPLLGRYFDPNSPEELADILFAVIREHVPATAEQARLNALNELPSRINRFGKSYESIVQDLIHVYSPR